MNYRDIFSYQNKLESGVNPVYQHCVFLKEGDYVDAIAVKVTLHIFDTEDTEMDDVSEIILFE